jgi:general secretion pathway protein A
MARMYLSYFGLQEAPFSIAVNPRYLFMSDRHRDALAHLLYGVGTGGGFVLLTGEVGTGKTTINRCLLEQLPDDTDIAIVLNPALNAVELLATVCDELGVEYGPDDCSLKPLTDRLHAYLLQNHQRNRRTVLLIDEAQHLQFDVLEQIRLLTNLETNTQKLLQIILVGQPELAVMLARPELRQLSQRISARFELEPLNLPETQAYINHRLQVAGMPPSQELFPPRVVRAVYKRSGGIPRLINLLCDRMLLGCYGKNKIRVDMAVFRVAQAEVFGTELEASKNSGGSRPSLGLGLALGITVLVLIAIGVWRWPQEVTEAARVASTEVSVPTTSSTVVAPRGPKLAAYWNPDFGNALAQLALLSGMTMLNRYDDGVSSTSCNILRKKGWECINQNAQSWNEVMEFGRPALLSLLTEERFRVYVLLESLQGENAHLLLGQQRLTLPVSELARHWNGEFTLLWQPPENYSLPVSLGAKDPLVNWLGRQFALLDGQTSVLGQEEFNMALDTRVRLFQRQHGLTDDGVVGVKTLMNMQQALITAQQGPG